MKMAAQERDFLFFSELEDRWQMKAVELFNLILLGHLKPSIKITQEMFRPRLNYSSDLGVFRTGVVDKSDGTPYSSFYPGWLYLQLPKQTGPLDLEFELSSYVRDPNLSQMSFDYDSEVWYLLPVPLDFENIKSRVFFLHSEVGTCETNLGIENYISEMLPVSQKVLFSLDCIVAILEKQIIEKQRRKFDGEDIVKRIRDGVEISVSMKVIRKSMGANDLVPKYALIAELARVAGVNLEDPKTDAGSIARDSKGTNFEISRNNVLGKLRKVAMALQTA